MTLDTTNMLELAAIDMQAPEAELVPQIMKQLTGLGFLHITNVPGFNEKALFKVCKAFHSMPSKEKDKLKWKNHNPANENRYRGLAPFVDNDESHKELFDMGQPQRLLTKKARKISLYEETPFPSGAKKYDVIRKSFEEQYQLRLKIGIKLASLIAIGLGKPRDFFKSWFEKDSLSTFRSIMYLPRCKSVVKQDKLSSESLKLTTPAHADTGFLTLLTTFGYPGL
jgi:isopenicillin N synthase-like dioxygenase